MSRAGKSVIVSLCDLTGNMVRPWVEAGYTAVLVDPQHEYTHWESQPYGWSGNEATGDVLKLAHTVESALASGVLQQWVEEAAMVFAFPPCTDFAVSGARWFKRKYEADPLFQVKAMVVAEQCRTIGRMSRAPYMIENPSGILSTAWGKPQHMFNPFDFTAYEVDDNYKKRTCLWTGNGFKMPPPKRYPGLGPPDERIYLAGESKDRQNFRSETPMGLARAVYDENKE
jgi:hypothetical protein